MTTFTFGTPTTSTTTGFGPSTGFNLTGTPFESNAPQSTLSFGTSSTPAITTGLSFGFNSTPATLASTQQSGLLLGSNTAATTTASSLFATPTTSAPLFGNLSFGTPAVSNALRFGIPAATSTTGNVSFGAPTTTTSLFSGGGLLGTKLVTSTTVATTTATNKGLGGLDVSLSNKGLSQGNINSGATKENVWPLWGNTIPTPSATNITVGSLLKPPTANLTFNTPSNLTAPLPTSESNSSFQLQKPTIGNKRGNH